MKLVLRFAAIALILVSLAQAAEMAPGAVQFLENRMAQIKGQIPGPQLPSGVPPPKCGTSVTLAIFAAAHWNDQPQLLDILQRPANLTDTLGSTHFLVHYTMTGVDTPYQAHVDTLPNDGVPDYINRVSDVFENVWRVEIESLGYNPPPTDNGMGGDNRYDVYVDTLGRGYFGFTTPEDTVSECIAWSYIEIENDYAEASDPRYRANPILPLKVTAAHEFFHAVQFGYDACEFDFVDPSDPFTYKPWWEEASSTWMENVVYNDINDYVAYLPYFYKYLWMGLGTFSYIIGTPELYHPYASAVWPIYMTEKFDNLDIMRQIWTICGQVQGYNTLPATDNVLRQNNATLQNAFEEFEVWNFHTGEFADTIDFFKEGILYPEAETAAYVSDLRSGPFSLGRDFHPPQDLAGRFIIIQSYAQSEGGVKIDFNGQDISVAGWYVAILGYRAGDSRWRDMQVDPPTGSGLDAWPGWNLYRDIVVIPTVSGLTPQYDSYSYTGSLQYDPTLTGGVGIPGLKVLATYPSPFVIDGSQSANIGYSLDQHYDKGDLAMWIFDLSGGKVREIPGTNFRYVDPGEYREGVQWDGRNSNNEYVASGIYICVLSAGSNSATGKIAVVNDSR